MNILEAFEELNTINRLNESEEDALIAQERAELAELCKKITDNIDIETINEPVLNIKTLYLGIVGEPVTINIHEDDFDDEETFIEVRAEKAAKEDSVNYLCAIAETLGISSSAVKQGLQTKSAIDIPGSSWQLLGDYDLESMNDPVVYSSFYDPGDYYNPPYSEFDCDEEAIFQATFYLVKRVK